MEGAASEITGELARGHAQGAGGPVLGRELRPPGTAALRRWLNSSSARGEGLTGRGGPTHGKGTTPTSRKRIPRVSTNELSSAASEGPSPKSRPGTCPFGAQRSQKPRRAAAEGCGPRSERSRTVDGPAVPTLTSIGPALLTLPPNAPHHPCARQCRAGKHVPTVFSRPPPPSKPRGACLLIRFEASRLSPRSAAGQPPGEQPGVRGAPHAGQGQAHRPTPRGNLRRHAQRLHVSSRRVEGGHAEPAGSSPHSTLGTALQSLVRRRGPAPGRSEPSRPRSSLLQ